MGYFRVTGQEEDYGREQVWVVVVVVVVVVGTALLYNDMVFHLATACAVQAKGMECKPIRWRWGDVAIAAATPCCHLSLSLFLLTPQDPCFYNHNSSDPKVPTGSQKTTIV
jgi:hypothetical protein